MISGLVHFVETMRALKSDVYADAMCNENDFWCREA